MLNVWSRRILGLALTLVAMSLAPRVIHAQTGKVTGIVTDQATGQPLEGVQVFLQGTGYGTLTNANGRFFLISVPPATYTVAARRIGYATAERSNVIVQIDVTREVNFALTTSTVLTTVRTTAEAVPLIPPDQTGSGLQVSSDDIEALPVTSIEGALALQQGFMQVTNSTNLISLAESRRAATDPVRIRGGRQGETIMLIDGIPTNNFIFGGPAFSLSPQAVQQIEFLKGGIDPQHGNALSGVINIATKEGGANLAGALRYQTSRVGDALGNSRDALLGYNLVEGFVSGPVPGTQQKLTFMFSGREERQADKLYEYDDEIFVPHLMPTTEAEPAGGPNFRDIFPGFRAFGYNNKRQVFGKLAYKFTPTMKFGLTLLDNENQRKPFDNQYLSTYGRVLESPAASTSEDSAVYIGNLTGYRLNGVDFERVVQSSIQANQRLFVGRFEHTFGRTNYKVAVGSFQNKRQTCSYFQGVCLGTNFGDPNFTDDQYIGPLAGTCAIHPTCGTDVDFGGENLTTFVLRGDLGSQVTDHHFIQGGMLYQRYDLDYNVTNNVGTNLVNVYTQQFQSKPYDVALYVQDKIEYDFLTLKLGARFDYGAVPGTFFADPLDPTNGTTALDVCRNPSDPRWAGGVRFTDFDAKKQPVVNTYTPDPTWNNDCSPDELKIAGKIAAFDDFKTAKARKQFSPRMGVSFPLSQGSTIFFNFGRYSQNPLLYNLLTNTGIGTNREGTTLGPCLEVVGEGNCGYIGNPNLQIERATTYEMGYNSEFGRNFALGVVLFNKNQTGLTGLRTGGVRRGKFGFEQVFDPAITYGASNTPSYSILVNEDFQSVRGFEVQLRRRVHNFWGFDVNYSFSRARTNSSEPEREFERQTQQGDPRNVVEVVSDIDQPHVFNAAIVGEVKKELPKFRGAWLLRDTRASVTMHTTSGYPYTPVTDYYGFGSAKHERNTGRGPSWSQVDAQLQKGFAIANLRYDAFLTVQNLFDKKNCVQVYESTGRCDAGAIDQSRARQGNSIAPDIATSTFTDRGDFYGPRRSFLGGIKVNF